MSKFLVTKLHNGVLMPALSLGSYKVDPGVSNEALRAGYRGIDTAFFYKNEEGIGKQLQELGEFEVENMEKEIVPITENNQFTAITQAEFVKSFAHPHGKPTDNRQVFVTTKVWVDHYSAQGVKDTIDHHCKCLGRDQIDLLLMHWPGPHISLQGCSEEIEQSQKNPKNQETRHTVWQEFEKAYASGKVRAIGVSNFVVHHLEPMIADIEKRKAAGDKNAVVPMVNQIEISPFLAPDEKLVEFGRAHDIKITAYSMLGAEYGITATLENPTLVKVAKAHDVDVPSVVGRWCLQKGFLIIPRSNSKVRVRRNLNCQFINLSSEEIAEVDGLKSKEIRFRTDPYEII